MKSGKKCVVKLVKFGIKKCVDIMFGEDIGMVFVKCKLRNILFDDDE